MATNQREQDLISQAIGGDSLAIQQLLVRHFAPIERHVASLIPGDLQSVLAAEDVMQDSFQQAIRDVGRFQGKSDAEFFGWLRTIAEHRLTDAVKGLRRQKRGGNLQQVRPESPSNSMLALVEMLCGESRTPGRSAARREVAQAVQVHVAALPDDQREAVRAKYFQGCDVAEIAERLDRSPGAIRGLLRRAHQRLGELLGASSRWISH